MLICYKLSEDDGYLDGFDFFDDSFAFERLETFVKDNFSHVQLSGKTLRPDSLIVGMLDPSIHQMLILV